LPLPFYRTVNYNIVGVIVPEELCEFYVKKK